MLFQDVRIKFPTTFDLSQSPKELDRKEEALLWIRVTSTQGYASGVNAGGRRPAYDEFGTADEYGRPAASSRNVCWTQSSGEL